MAFDNGASSAMAYNNNVVASDPKFVKTTFNEIKESDDETRNLVSNTFGQLKKYVEGMFYCNGFSTNVSNAYYSAMNDPNDKLMSAIKFIVSILGLEIFALTMKWEIRQADVFQCTLTHNLRRI